MRRRSSAIDLNFSSRSSVGVHRRVHRVERQIQEERLLAMLLDERDRLAGERIGQVLLFFDWLVAAEDGRTLTGEIRVCAAEEAEELVEAALLRTESIAAAQVPLADQAGRIAGRLQPIGNRRFRKRQSKSGPTRAAASWSVGLVGRLILRFLCRLCSLLRASLPLVVARIELMAEPRLIAARQQAGTRRRTIRAGDVTARAADAGVGQRVDIRRGDVRAAVHADVGIAHVVADDHDDVGPARLRGDQFRSQRSKNQPSQANTECESIRSNAPPSKSHVESSRVPSPPRRIRRGEPAVHGSTNLVWFCSVLRESDMLKRNSEILSAAGRRMNDVPHCVQ